MNQSDDAVALIKERADIIQIIGETMELRRSGSRYVGLCPFHGEKTPSFSVSGEGYFHCFGCGESGDVLSYVMKYYSLTFPEALSMLAERYGVMLPEKKQSAKEKEVSGHKKELYRVAEKVAGLYRDYLHRDLGAAVARDYLKKRGVKSELAQEYGLGYAPATESEGWHFLGKHLDAKDLSLAEELGLVAAKKTGGYYDRFRDRILFPIMDISGRVCGFGGRIIGEGQPKYMNSPDSIIFNKSQLLLGLYQQKEAIRKTNTAIFVEGNFDLISLVASGVKNVVAPLGTALTREQVRLVKRFAETGVLLFDGDEAGVKAAVRSVPIFLAEHMAGKVALLPGGDDPDTYVRAHGKKGVLTLLDSAQPLPEFAYDDLVREHGLSVDGKARVVEGLKPLVAAAASPLQRSVLVSHFAGELGMDAALLEQNLEGVQDPSAQTFQQASVPPPMDEPPPFENEGWEEFTLAPKRIELSPVQRRFVEFLIFNPNFIGKIQDAGGRKFLEGSCGEIILLELEACLREHGRFEPEEFLALMPQGQERQIVAEILLKTNDILIENEAEHECQELCAYLGHHLLSKRSQEILAEIKALGASDPDKSSALLQEKIQIERKLRENRGM